MFTTEVGNMGKNLKINLKKIKIKCRKTMMTLTGHRRLDPNVTICPMVLILTYTVCTQFGKPSPDLQLLHNITKTILGVTGILA
jgi:hypothetical protein